MCLHPQRGVAISQVVGADSANVQAAMPRQRCAVLQLRQACT